MYVQKSLNNQRSWIPAPHPTMFQLLAAGAAFLLATFSPSPLFVSPTPWDTLNVNAPPSDFRHVLTSYLIVDLLDLRFVKTGSGTRVNVAIVGGNWTSPSGDLIGSFVPGLGGEHGVIDSAGLLHLDVRYSLQFVKDQKFAYVEFKGTGKAAQSNRCTVRIETDSEADAELGLTQKELFAPGVFVGDVLVASYWAAL